MAGLSKLTNTQIKNASADDKEYTMSDGGNLYLRVRKNGSKNWLFIYTDSNTKKRKKIGLGSYPTMTLAEVRKVATELREQAANGIDPRVFREKQKFDRLVDNNLTFKAVAEKMLEKEEAQELINREALIRESREQARINGTEFGKDEIDRIINKVRSSYRKRLFLKRNLYPKLANLPLSYITPSGAIDVIAPLQAKGQLENVKRACCIANQVMKFGVNAGIVKYNCLVDIKSNFAKSKVVHMSTVPPNELKDVMEIMSENNMKPVTRCAFEMQLHTMTRADELAAMRWCDIDFENRL
ncbi:tyrosine-type recombinase/integrase, partial [Vibrio maerlii]|uniref:tyrosine-type recombinase/integrase n=1 Tax=Vibrio maerlii TaxID=2231648 RepID=UPI000E3E8DA7